VLSNPSSLSYFMEFMDRRHRSLLVQFWLTVESFKNPLESVDSSSSDDDDDAFHAPSDAVTVKEDITMIHDLYFSSPSLPPALSNISHKHIDVIRNFAMSEQPSSTAVERKVRRSVLLVQRQVEREMEHDFGDFRQSELWFRVAGDASIRASATTPLPTQTAFTSPKLTRSPTGDAKGFLPATRPIARADSTPSLAASLSSSSRPFPSSTSLPSEPVTSTLPPRPKLSNLALLMSSGGESTTDMRTPLFDESDEPDILAPDEAQQQRIEAIQSALTDIILEQQETESSGLQESPQRPKPTTRSSKPVVSPNGKRRVLFEDEIHAEEEDALEDEDKAVGSFKLAAPGDLQLSYDIARLTDKINNLQSQDGMLNTLIKKAELTGDAQELRLLRQSKASLDRELRELTFQKTQYEQQESANRLLSDRTKLAIVNSTVGEENGRSVVRYLVEVQQLAQDGGFASGWVVARRYNEFLNMHNKLRERYVLVRSLDFPGKRLVTALSGSFVDTRRIALEKYMQVQ
jgi:sorting nexin-25